MKTLRLSLIELLVVAGFTVPGRADVIYDNTAHWLGGYGFTALEQGDEVYAAGSARWVTKLTIGVSHQGEPGTADLQARLYANDGAGGIPGTPLWQSAVMANTPLSGGVQLVSFAVPDVLVPDSFTWTLQVLAYTIPAVGLVNGDPPAVGSSPNFDWFGGPGHWTQLDYSDWIARVEAIPEPSSALLLLGALAVLAWRRK